MIVLELALSLGALFGGAVLVIDPDGGWLGLPLSLLAKSPFHSFLWPGLILFGVLGLGPAMSAMLAVRRSPLAPFAELAVGAALIIWIAVEMLFLAGPGSIAWSLYLVLGAAIAMLGLRRLQR